MTKQTQKQRRNRLRQRLVEMRGRKCALCGESFEVHQFDFHHVIPETKSFPLTSTYMTSKSWKTILEEANKCIMVCANCHRDIHFSKERNGSTDS